MKNSLLKRLLLSAALLLAQGIYAQVSVKGHVVMSSTSEDAAGAVVTLYLNDSIPVAQTQTDADGLFAVKSEKSAEKMLLKVSLLGCKPEVIGLLADAPEIDAGYVYLTESAVNLNEVTVYGSGIIEKVDKYLVLPSKAQLDRAPASIDLFSQLDLPGLRSDPVTRTIRVEGGSPVYLVNGRQQDLNRILNLNPQDILRIEYSNNPGPRYIEQGYTGVINVVLRAKTRGGSVYGNAQSAVTTGTADAGVQGSYNTDKSEILFAYYFSLRDFNKWRNDSWERYIAPDREMERVSTGLFSDMYYQTHSFQLEYNYQPDLQTLFSARLSHVLSDQDSSPTSIVRETAWDGSDVEFKNSLHQQNLLNIPVLDLFFKKSFKNKQTIEVNAVGKYSRSNPRESTLYDYTDPVIPDWRYDRDNDVYGWGIGGELVYGKEFEKVNLRVGGQYQYNKSITDYVETELSGREVLSTNHGYAYGELTGSFGKLNYNLGLGLKTLTTKNGATSHTTVSNNTTLTLMMPFGKGWSLNYIVFHRPTPPSISQLSTVESVVDDYYIYQGNPDLKSGQMIYNRIQFRYAHKNGFSATFRLKYGRTFNPIVRTVYYDAAREKFIGRPNNEKHLDDPGVELSLSKQRLWDHLDLSGRIGYTYFISEGDSYRHTYDNVFASVQALAYFGKWSISGYWYCAPARYLQGENISQDQSSSSLGVRYRLNNNFMFFASWNFIFAKEGWVYESENWSAVHPGSSKTMIRSQRNMVMIGITFNMNFGKRLEKSQRTLNNTNFEI